MRPLLRMSIVLLVAAFILPPLSKAQKTFPVNGVFDERAGLFAFTNATIFKSWNEKIENATLIVRDGRVEAIGASITIPKDAVVIDLKKRFVYPSFIEPFGNYGCLNCQLRQLVGDAAVVAASNLFPTKKARILGMRLSKRNLKPTRLSIRAQQTRNY